MIAAIQYILRILMSIFLISSIQNAEEGDLAKIMMSKKTKRLYGRMQHGIQKKKDAVDRLEEKRKEIETTASSSAEPANKKQKKVAIVPAAAKEVPQQKAEQKKVDKKSKQAPAKDVAAVNSEKGQKRKR